MQYIPYGKRIAWEVYNDMTLNSERWLTFHGLPFLVNIYDHGIGSRLYIRKKYAAGRISEINRFVHPGDKVIDIGANIGFFTILLAKLVGPEGKVYAFEPDPRNLNILRKNVQRNEFKNVEIIPKAVSNKSGTMTLYQTYGWSANAIIPIEDHVSSTKVDVVYLDDYLSEENDIKFVKIDTDGSESFVIEGMKNLIQKSPKITILLEYEPGNLKRYLDNPFSIFKVAENHSLKLESIMDTEKGRLPSLDFTSLENLKDNENLDILFTKED